MSHPAFDLTDRIAAVTGGAGLLGRQHARAIVLAGGVPVLVDLPAAQPADVAAELSSHWATPVYGYACDITDEAEVAALAESIISAHGRVDILINNAANNPKQEATGKVEFSRLENFSLEQWDDDIRVGLTGAFLMSRALGTLMAGQRKGVILNIASDLALIGPDQRLYKRDGLPDDQQPVKPITYSIVKSGLIGLTRYLATYWATSGVRVNAISPGGVFNNQPLEFVERLSQLIPMGRMANIDEYQGAIIFLCSDASSYITGANLSADGGRTCW